MKKQLLNESDIRRMMKFANIAPLTDGFVERLNEASETTALEEDDALEEGESLEEDDTLEEMEHPKKDDKEGVQEEGMGAYGKDDDEPVDEMPPMDDDDMSMDEPAAGGAEGEMTLSDEEAQVLIDLGNRLAAAQGDEEPVGDMDLGAEDDLGLGAEDEDEEMPMEEDLDEELVNEVIARVARRLRSSE
jgi:hypothetical protein